MRYILFILSSLLWAVSFGARPVRHILTRNTAGEPVMLPYNHRSCEVFSGKTCFPSSSQQIATRAFHTVNPDGIGKYGESAAGIVPSIGEPIIPVVMVEFDDVAFQSTTTPELVNRYFNEKGFNSAKGWGGSVRDYFVDQSYGLFSPKFNVVGKVKLPKPRAYYGKNSGNSAHVNIDEFYRTAVRQALQLDVSFQPFESAQQKIPLVILYFAGASENSSSESGSEDYIWSAFMESSYKIDGHDFQSYLVVGELINYYKSESGELLLDSQGKPIIDYAELEGPGVKCHEICHALGLPDVYDTQNNYLETPDYLDLMDYGQYVTTMGERPMGLSAYERSCLGWLRTLELDNTAGYYQLLPLHGKNLLESSNTVAQAFLLRNPQNPKECYILENRQPSTWFPANLGSGMLIYHIDYDATAWEYNRVNVDDKQQRYAIVPADGKRQTHNKGEKSEFAGDFFPGTKNISTWSGTTSPSIGWQSGNFDFRALYGISIKERSLNVGFAFNDESLVGVEGLQLSKHFKELDGRYYDLDGRLQLVPQQGHIYLLHGQKVMFYNP